MVVTARELRVNGAIVLSGHHGWHPGYKKALEEYGGTPDSEVIESGDCTPGSEGVKFADRKDRKDCFGMGYGKSPKK